MCHDHMYPHSKMNKKPNEPSTIPTFIDLFSGCGGLSLGMTNAGFRGIFAVEKAADAFLTFRSNLLDNEEDPRFAWPKWLPKKNIGIEDFLAKYSHRLAHLRKVSLITGGPPCQGFSFAGRRNGRDPRNKLFRKYVAFVDAVKPQMIMLENVPGMKAVHGDGKTDGKGGRRTKRKSYYDELIEALARIGYAAEGRTLNATSFGVPQGRSRLVVVGLREELLSKLDNGFDEIFECIEACAKEQMRQIGFKQPVSAKEALSDLETASGKLIPYTIPDSHKGFQMLQYSKPTTTYQKLMNGGIEREQMDSMRLARHTDAVAKRFSSILDECERGVNVSETHRKRFGMLKHRTLPMSPSKPAPTLTTLPDDVLHYSEPRILTVREYARIQSFPDWFQFKGKYTTGGDQRKKDCPRYTQVGNAVPPLLAQGIGHALLGILEQLAIPKPQRVVSDVQTTRGAVAVPIKYHEPATF